MAGWSTRDIPDQDGRVAVVTGANSGIGLPTARELARRGARVVLACRDTARGEAAAASIAAAAPGADVEVRPLDLGDLGSVRAFAASFPYGRLDLLINNAGVMAIPLRRTKDGFETQMGVNHLGHFALTGLLLPRLLGTPGARVVSLSSSAHLGANVDPRDLNSERGYHRWMAYCRSKSANLLFVHGLSRRLAAAGSGVVVAAAHPGLADTGLQTASARMQGHHRTERVVSAVMGVVGQSAEAGALPTLYAATAPGVLPDSFTGPRVQGLRGAPAPSWRAPWTRNDAAAEVLWEASEQLTGVRYDGLVIA